MNRIVLIFWNDAEASERLERLRAAGFEAEHLRPAGGADLKRLAASLPDAIVIDLGRLPSHGLAVAVALRQSKATRGVPLVFLSGRPERLQSARAVLPDATFGDWDGVAAVIRTAMSNQPARPAAPGAMAPYSGTPLPKKLGIRPGAAVTLLGAEEGFAARLEPLPEGARLRRKGRARTVLLFSAGMAELKRRFPAAARSVEEGGGLWLLWPKKASGRASDLSEAAVRKFGLDAGWVDYKIAAVDETWSGLLFARRKSVAAQGD